MKKNGTMGPPIKFKNGTERVNLHLEPKQHAQLKAYAKKHKLKLSTVVRLALDQLFQNSP